MLENKGQILNNISKEMFFFIPQAQYIFSKQNQIQIKSHKNKIMNQRTIILSEIVFKKHTFSHTFYSFFLNSNNSMMFTILL